MVACDASKGYHGAGETGGGVGVGPVRHMT